MFKLYFDGCVAPCNPGGFGGYGLVVFDDDRVIFSEAVYVGCWPELSNNCMEYCGAIAALRFLIREGIEDATIYGDADLIINQLNGKWKAKRGAYLPYHQEAWALRQRLPKVVMQWIPREMNTHADELSKQSVTQRPLIIGFNLDVTVEPVAPAIIPKRARTRDKKNQQVLLPDLDDERVIEQFKQMYG